MIQLPNRSAKCDAPIPRNDRIAGDLLPSEESASFLLWAWPRLLGWPRPVNWLFSPVVGNKVYPGDLWGIDSHGDLLIVETKLDRTRRLQDPFANFVPYCAGPAWGVWQADSLRARWLDLSDKEAVFINEHAGRLEPDSPLIGTYRGVLPYSVHRITVWRWQSVFLKQVVPKFHDGSYRKEVERSLKKREDKKNPPPVFFGLIATTGSSDPRLSISGRAALVSLYRILGGKRICLRAMRVERDGFHRVRIKCWTLPSVQMVTEALSSRSSEK